MKSQFIILPIIIILSISCNSDKTSADSNENSKSVESSTDDITKNPNMNLYWGDTHLHTSYSPDAFAGGTRLDPDAAFRFAKGESVKSNGISVQLDRSLDFLVVADHAEGLGLINEVINENPILMEDPLLKRWSRQLGEGGKQAAAVGRELIDRFAAGKLPEILNDRKIMGPLVYKIWADHLTTTERHNEPGKFTSFIGYEWSSLPQGNNLHRVVIYRDGKDKAIQSLPYSSSISSDPEDLWKALQKYEDKTGGQVLAIPHNGNISNGLMFTLTDFSGNAMTESYASVRSRWEPLVETTQIKGDSESHPFLSPNDEFANFGVAGWEAGNLNFSSLKKNEMLQYEYSREALKNGLLLEEQLGINPFQFGMIGSTDSHTSMATADDDNYLGKFTRMAHDKERALRLRNLGPAAINNTTRYNWQYLASGYAAVWAESNTREDLWDAMKRREVFGTTGPRIQLRFFGGWNFTEADMSAADYVSIGYEKGVPMGSNILKNIKAESPSFLIAASRDPDGANLDRVQIIKGWTKEGQTFEKIYNVVWSGERNIHPDGKLPTVGNSVDIELATFTNDIGVAELSTLWIDPDFNPDNRAFYYVRVLEIPTPRWSTYDAARYDLELLDETPKTVQQRAYSSPIWYSPY